MLKILKINKINPLVFGISGKGKALGFEVFNFKKEWLILDKAQFFKGEIIMN